MDPYEQAARLQDEEALVCEALARLVEMALTDQAAVAVLRKRAAEARERAAFSRAVAEQERQRLAEWSDSGQLK